MKRPHRGIYRYYCYYRWICLSHFLRAGLAQLNLARLCSKGVLGNSVIKSYRERRRLPIPISEIFGPPSPTSILLYPLFCLKGKNSPKLPWQVLESVHRTAREMTSLVNRNVCFEACLYFFLARKHLSTLYSFRGLPLPTFQLNDASMGASADESSPEKNTYNTMNSQQSNEQHCTNVYMEWPRITLERKFKSSVCQIIIKEAITCQKYLMLGLALVVHDLLDIMPLVHGMTLLLTDNVRKSDTLATFKRDIKNAISQVIFIKRCVCVFLYILFVFFFSVFTL